MHRFYTDNALQYQTMTNNRIIVSDHNQSTSTTTSTTTTLFPIQEEDTHLDNYPTTTLPPTTYTTTYPSTTITENKTSICSVNPVNSVFSRMKSYLSSFFVSDPIIIPTTTTTTTTTINDDDWNIDHIPTRNNIANTNNISNIDDLYPSLLNGKIYEKYSYDFTNNFDNEDSDNDEEEHKYIVRLNSSANMYMYDYDFNRRLTDIIDTIRTINIKY